MGQREHCILITPVLPRQHGAGLEQRAFFLVEDLAIRYDITLFIASDPPLTLDEITEASPALMALIKSCRPIAVRHARGLRRKLALLFPPIVGWRPAWATEWPVPSSVLPPLPESVDLLAVFRMRMHTTAKFVARNTAPRYCLLDLDDLEPTTLKSMARQAFRRGRLRFAAHLMCMSKQQALLERRIVPAYNRVLLANPDDVRELMSREPFVQIDCRPNRVRLQSNGERRTPDGPFTLSFLATLDYFPNIDAALWIVEELAPKLRRQFRARGKDLRIQIAGRGASKRLRKRLGRVEQLEFLGPVDDLRSFYDGSHAAIIPVHTPFV
jgi:glycosyltransferase involved in cell wall biosynthesis